MTSVTAFEHLANGSVSALAEWDRLIGHSYAGTRIEGGSQRCRAQFERLRLGNIRIARIMAEPHRVRRWHDHAPSHHADVTYLHVQGEGRSITRQGGASVVLDRGMAAFCNPNENYTVEFPDAYSVYLVEIPNSYLPAHHAAMARDGGIPLARSGLLHGMLGQIFYQSAALVEQPDWALGVSGALTSLLRSLSPAAPQLAIDGGRPEVSPAMRAAVLTMIERHFADPELCVGAVAQALRVSRRSVQRVFAGQAGGASGYILERRLRRAAELLAGPEQGGSITGIALGSGFGDSSHFARCFRARFGMTPSAFRQGQGIDPLRLSDLS